jgi:hypothetical protein
MAEYVTHDELRAEVAEFRLEIRDGFAALRTEMGQTETRLERSLTRSATIGGFSGGIVSALSAYIAVSLALARILSGTPSEAGSAT